MADELTIVADGRQINGWQSIRLTRGIERFPSDFSVEVTQKDLTGATSILNPFDPIEVYLGEDKVLTGYIDTVAHRISASEHQIDISGRSKCEDLVDCSAEFSEADSSGIQGVPLLVQRNKDVLSLARELSAPYGITVTLNSDRSTVLIPVMQVNIGETPYEIIERFARSQNLLVYDAPDGNLILSDIGNSEMSSGFELGQNIESLAYNLAFHERYSEIDVFDQTAASQGTMDYNTQFGMEFDPSIRHRRLMLFSETPFISTAVWTKQRAIWEMNRRIGRSKVISLTTDSWRDSAGKLWQPNSYVTTHAPSFGLDKLRWVIADVTYSRDMNSGTTASLTIMSPEAFSIEPTNLFPSNAALQQAGPATDITPEAQPSIAPVGERFKGHA